MMAQLTLFHALADPARLRIVEAMKSGERAVGDIAETMDIHQSGVSRHLRILADAGIVQMRPDGQKRLYSLRKGAFDQLDAWVAGYRRHWEARLDRFGAALLITVVDGAIQRATTPSNSNGSAVVVNPSASEAVLTEALRSTINIPPTVHKDQGDRIQVLVARDLDFRSVYDLRLTATTRPPR